jgi:hypothetical protein
VLGKYYPAISSYFGGSATVNFGPDFAHPAPSTFQPFCEATKVPKWADLKAALRVDVTDANAVASTNTPAHGPADKSNVASFVLSPVEVHTPETIDDDRHVAAADVDHDVDEHQDLKDEDCEHSGGVGEDYDNAKYSRDEHADLNCTSADVMMDTDGVVTSDVCFLAD